MWNSLLVGDEAAALARAKYNENEKHLNTNAFVFKKATADIWGIMSGKAGWCLLRNIWQPTQWLQLPWAAICTQDSHSSSSVLVPCLRNAVLHNAVMNDAAPLSTG